MSNKVDAPLDDLERQIYELLKKTFHREECSAKAVARLEYDIVQQYQAERAPPSAAAEDVDPDEEATKAEFVSSRDFSADEFQALFTSINTLRMVHELVNLLGVQQLGAEIISTLIAESFKPRVSGTAVGRGGGEQTFIGNDMDMTFHKLRQQAASNQRTAQRSSK
jgi:hypothetical protein